MYIILKIASSQYGLVVAYEGLEMEALYFKFVMASGLCCSLVLCSTLLLVCFSSVELRFFFHGICGVGGFGANFGPTVRSPNSEE